MRINQQRNARGMSEEYKSYITKGLVSKQMFKFAQVRSGPRTQPQ